MLRKYDLNISFIHELTQQSVFISLFLFCNEVDWRMERVVYTRGCVIEKYRFTGVERGFLLTSLFNVFI